MVELYKKVRSYACGLCVLAALTLVSGCEESNNSYISQGKSATGNFLAAKYAQKNNDYEKAIFYYQKALTQDPDNDNLLKNLYNLEIITGNYEQAALLAKKHLTINKDAYFANLIMALKSFHENKFKQAEKSSDKLTNTNMQLHNILLPSLKIWQKVGQKKFSEALNFLDTSDNIAGLDDFNSYQRAIIYELSDNIVGAKTLFDRLTEKPYSYKISKSAIDFYRRNGFQDDAYNAIKRYHDYNKNRLSPNQYNTKFEETTAQKLNAKEVAQKIMANVLGEMASMFFSTAQFDEAIIYYRLSLYLNESDDGVQILLANTLEKNGLYQDALKIYQSIPNDSRFKQSINQDIAIVYNKMGKLSQAKAMLISFKDKNSQRIDALLNLGDILVANKDFEEAAKYYEQAISRLKNIKEDTNPRHWPIFYALAICYEQTNRWQKAEETFLEALNLSPNQPDVINYLAYSWLMKGVKINEAEEMLKIAVTKRPQDAHILDSYGWALYKLGKYQDALFFIEQANARIPYDPTTNDHLGDIYWKGDRKTEAVFMWKRALTFNPKPDDAIKIKIKIKHGPDGLKKISANPKLVKSEHISQQ